MIPEPKNKDEKYREILCKFETLAWFCQRKQDTIRKINDRLADKVEIALFPKILEKSMATPPATPEKEKYMISVSGKKRSKFFHNKLGDYFKMYKKDLMLGYIHVDRDSSRFVIDDG